MTDDDMRAWRKGEAAAASLVAALGDRLGHCSTDTPAPEGEVHIDLLIDGMPMDVVWREGRGYGLYDERDKTFESPPREWHRDPTEAADRILAAMPRPAPGLPAP